MPDRQEAGLCYRFETVYRRSQYIPGLSKGSLNSLKQGLARKSHHVSLFYAAKPTALPAPLRQVDERDGDRVASAYVAAAATLPESTEEYVID